MSIDEYFHTKSTTAISTENIKKLIISKNIDTSDNDNIKQLLSLTLIKNKNSDDLLKFLISKKTPLNSVVFYEFLYDLCEKGKNNLIKILLDNDIIVNCQNDEGETPLHIAIRQKNYNLIKLLLEYSPDLTLCTYKNSLNCYNYLDNCDDINIKNLIYNDTRTSNIEFLTEKSSIDINKNYTNPKIDNKMQNEPSYNQYRNSNKTKKNIKKVESKLSSGINNSFYSSSAQTNNTKLNDDNKISIRIMKGYPMSLTNYYCCPKKLNSNENNQQITYNTIILNTNEFFENYDDNNNRDSIWCFMNNCNNPKIKNQKLDNFFKDINLPQSYLKKFTDNNINDLDYLISQNKNRDFLTDDFLKQIGINKPGHRAKIIIHLDEISGNFDFLLEKEIIYAEKQTEKMKDGLYKFLARINLDEYLNNFINNDYLNVELLLTQMLTNQPITEEFLLNDINIIKIGYRTRLINSLKNEAKQYKLMLNDKTIKGRNATINKSFYIDNVNEPNNTNICEACLIF